MMARVPLLLAAVAAFAATPAVAQSQPQPKEASIDFADHGGIRDWEADATGGLFLRDRTGSWYHATFVGQCPNLGWTRTIKVNADANGTLDRFGSIDTGMGRCAIASIVKSAAPASHDSRSAKH